MIRNCVPGARVIRLAHANGPVAGQFGFHLRFHVISRRADDVVLFNWEM